MKNTFLLSAFIAATLTHTSGVSAQTLGKWAINADVKYQSKTPKTTSPSLRARADSVDTPFAVTGRGTAGRYRFSGSYDSSRAQYSDAETTSLNLSLLYSLRAYGFGAVLEDMSTNSGQSFFEFRTGTSNNTALNNIPDIVLNNNAPVTVPARSTSALGAQFFYRLGPVNLRGNIMDVASSDNLQITRSTVLQLDYSPTRQVSTFLKTLNATSNQTGNTRNSNPDMTHVGGSYKISNIFSVFAVYGFGNPTSINAVDVTRVAVGGSYFLRNIGLNGTFLNFEYSSDETRLGVGNENNFTVSVDTIGVGITIPFGTAAKSATSTYFTQARDSIGYGYEIRRLPF